MPWFAYLKNRVNSRIFQDQSVPGVIEQIFRSDYAGLAAFEFRTNQVYALENYIVQYDETDEHFVSRLMEKHDLFYYFKHGPCGHVMIISDDSRSGEFCPPQSVHADIEPSWRLAQPERAPARQAASPAQVVMPIAANLMVRTT